MAKAQDLYEITLQKSATGSGQTHAGVQEKINTLLVDIRLYEKGLKVNFENKVLIKRLQTIFLPFFSFFLPMLKRI